MSKILNAKSLVADLLNNLRKERSALGKISLASLTVGKDEATSIYLTTQKKLAKALNIDYKLYEFKKTASMNAVKKLLRELNKNKLVKGIIIHKPLPPKWDEFTLSQFLSPEKDIEGITPYNLGRILLRSPLFLPPTVLSILEVLKIVNLNLWGKNTVIVGFSLHIGKPLSILLADEFSTVSITHIATYKMKQLPSYIRKADVLISCVGRPHFIKGEWIKKGAVVIDVGITKYKSKILGDIEFEEAKRKASFITPVPGGVGMLTGIFLFKNLLNAAKLTSNK